MSRIQKSQLFMRLAALSTALLCLWMGTLGTAYHTDTLRIGGSLSPAACLHHALPSPPAHVCAACEWTQGVQSSVLTAFAFAVPLGSIANTLSSLTLSIARHAPLRRSSRAPPACLAG